MYSIVHTHTHLDVASTVEIEKGILVNEWEQLNRALLLGMRDADANAPLLNVDPFRMSICSKWMLKSTVTRIERMGEEKATATASSLLTATTAMATATSNRRFSLRSEMRVSSNIIFFEVRRWWKVFTFELIILLQQTRNYEMLEKCGLTAHSLAHSHTHRHKVCVWYKFGGSCWR